MFFRVGDFVNLRLHREYSVFVIKSKKIEQQLINSFKITKRIDRLTYELELSTNMKIHNVISVAHLKSITNPRDDLYQRRRVSTSSLVIDGAEEFEIERMLAKRRIRKGTGWSTQYLVRWLSYGPEDDWWIPQHRLGHARKLIHEYERRFEAAAAIDDGTDDRYEDEAENDASEDEGEDEAAIPAAGAQFMTGQSIWTDLFPAFATVNATSQSEASSSNCAWSSEARE